MQPRLNVSKEFVFDAAHRLPNYDGPCERLHGHQWKLEVEVSGPVNEETGMVMDFVALKAMVNNLIINELDHRYLNDKFTNPTAENMVTEFVRVVEAFIRSSPKLLDDYIQLERIRLYETPTSFCEWKRSSCSC